jgi:hypothetical protein
LIDMLIELDGVPENVAERMSNEDFANQLRPDTATLSLAGHSAMQTALNTPARRLRRRFPAST